MAIALDAASRGSINNSTSSADWSHTCTGSNLVLLVHVAIELTAGVGATTASVTYNGVSMTLIDSASNALAGTTSAFFYLINPATGSNTVSVSATGTASYKYATAVSYTGVHQTTAIDAQSAIDSNSSTSQTASVTTVTANALAIAAYASLQGSTFATATSPAVVRQQFPSTDGYACHMDNGSPTASPGTVTIDWTFPASRNPNRMAYALRPVVTGPANVATWNGLALASMASLNGLSTGSIATINGLN